MRATGGSYGGLAQYWFYSVAASRDGVGGVGNYAFMTEDGLGEPADVVAEPPGWGLAGVWALGGCEVNC